MFNSFISTSYLWYQTDGMKPSIFRQTLFQVAESVANPAHQSTPPAAFFWATCNWTHDWLDMLMACVSKCSARWFVPIVTSIQLWILSVRYVARESTHDIVYVCICRFINNIRVLVYAEMLQITSNNTQSMVFIPRITLDNAFLVSSVSNPLPLGRWDGATRDSVCVWFGHHMAVSWTTCYLKDNPNLIKVKWFNQSTIQDTFSRFTCKKNTHTFVLQPCVCVCAFY